MGRDRLELRPDFGAAFRAALGECLEVELREREGKLMVAHQNTPTNNCGQDVGGSYSEHEVPIPVVRSEGSGRKIIDHDQVSSSAWGEMADGETEKT